jgi:hypothetical protein
MHALRILFAVAVFLLGSAAPGASDVLSLSWIDNATNEDGYIVQRANDPSGPFAEIARVPVDVAGYDDIALAPGATYCYRVRAFNAAGVSGASNTACGAAAAPALPVIALSVIFDGSTLVVTATLVPGTTPTVVDVYLVLQTPDGSFASLVGANTIVPGIAPAAVALVPTPFSGEILRHSFTGVEPEGTYRWYAALVATGTLEPVGNVAQVAFAY